ncbi:MAG: Ppx/GppA family phosphatase [Bacteroidales bacterium]|jgi:exopolyphosphatase/guanosine-5'-triphosphate,3'-diphosphate pyrophosphatase
MFSDSPNLRLAAIDIGSNAARIMICYVLETKKNVNGSNGNAEFIKLNFVRVPLRLGFDVFENGFISPKKEKDIIEAMHCYKYLMKVHNVQHFVACATSAMRDAKNSAEIIKRVKQSTGIDIKVISGKEEAASIFENHIEKYLDKEHSYLYIDVGGGSTELTLFDNNEPLFEESFDVGTVRMLKNKVDDKEWQRLKEFVKKTTGNYKNLVGIGSGGNINKISNLSKLKEGKPLTSEILKDYYDTLVKMTVEERMIKYSLREDRADVMIPALQIYSSVMRWANINDIYVPKFGLVDGLIRSLYGQLVGASTNKLN